MSQSADYRALVVLTISVLKHREFMYTKILTDDTGAIFVSNLQKWYNFVYYVYPVPSSCDSLAHDCHKCGFDSSAC